MMIMHNDKPSVVGRSLEPHNQSPISFCQAPNHASARHSRNGATNEGDAWKIRTYFIVRMRIGRYLEKQKFGVASAR